jgi:L-cysteine:1D-myo-inositol 2-amino-2-deoxy-alpha-D-glucopyranoside ligase
MALRLYSTLSRGMREFVPIAPGEVRIYVCGVTPYYVTHLGHAFSYVHFDTLRRYLISLGYSVRYVQNVTDIDDDMIRVSREQGRPIAEIRDENDGRFRADLDRLNVLRPTVYPYATDHIPQIIELTGILIERGHAYVADGDVFFEATTFPGYGALKGLALGELGKLENPESKRAEKKRGHLDFLLWQTVDPGDPSWESPWGPGRPGWSIECTAMSMTHLGPNIDIHGGGSDLIYPHHTNEIAQAEGVTGASPFCGFWMHNGMLRSQGRKMAKSKPETLVFARDLLDRFDADHLRLYLLSNHYRIDADYGPGEMERLAARYSRLLEAARRAPAANEPTHPVTAAFREAMDADLDTPAALDVLDAGASRILAGAGSEGEAVALRAALATLGFAFAGARGPATGDFTP